MEIKTNEKIRVRLESFNYELLNSSCQKIINLTEQTHINGTKIIPLPTDKRIYCVLRSPHVDKDSREQFEIRSSKRLLIISPTTQTVDALMKLNLSAGVNIKIALNENKN